MIEFLKRIESNCRQIAGNTWLSVFVLLIISIGCAIYSFDKLLHTNGDNAVYMILGGSLANGTGYHNMHTPAETFHSRYPPVLPAMIAVITWIIGGSFFNFKVMITLFYIGSVLAAFWAFREISKLTGLITALLLAVNFYIVDFGHWIMSEIPCLFFVIMTVGFLMRSTGENQKTDLYAGIFCALALLTRSAAIFLLPAALIYYFSRNDWKGAGIFSSVSIIPVILWGIYKNLSGAVGGGYTNSLFQVNPYRPELGMVSLGGIIDRMIENFSGYFGLFIPSMTFPALITDQKLAAIRSGQSDQLVLLISILITLTLLSGLWKSIKQKDWLFSFILLSGGGLLLIWPSVWMTQRFVIPIFPFVILAGMKGLGLLDRWSWGIIIKYLVFTVVILSSFIHLEPGRKSYPARFANYVNASRWIGRNSMENDIISCRKKEFTYLFSKRKCVGYKYSFDDKEVINQLRDRNVKFVIIDQLGFSSTPRYLVPALQKNKELFTVVYKTPKPENFVLQMRDES